MDLPAGAHLTEQGLADALNVSRTPCGKRSLISRLKDWWRKHHGAGIFWRVRRDPLWGSLDFPALDEDTLFERVATDHLLGLLPAILSEQDVVSQYASVYDSPSAR